jgi:hypothetical protein
MVDVAAISGAVGGLKAAIDIGKGIQALNTSTEVKQKTGELLDAVLDARFKLMDAADAQSALLDEIKQLKQQIAGFEDWNSEKERYQLKAIDSGAFAVMHKPGMENGEPPIWLCQTCFEKRHKSPLQFVARDRGSGAAGGRGTHARWHCNLCKSEITVYYGRQPHVPWEHSADDKPEPPSPSMSSVRLERG